MYTLVSTMAQRKNQSPHSSTNWGRSLSTRTLGGGGAPNSQREREREREGESPVSGRDGVEKWRIFTSGD